MVSSANHHLGLVSVAHFKHVFTEVSSELAPSTSSAFGRPTDELRADRTILLAVEMRRFAAALVVTVCGVSFVDWLSKLAFRAVPVSVASACL